VQRYYFLVVANFVTRVTCHRIFGLSYDLPFEEIISDY